MNSNRYGWFVIALVGFMFLMQATATTIDANVGVDVSINVTFDGQKAVCSCDMKPTIDWKMPAPCESCPRKLPNGTWLTYEKKTSSWTKPTPVTTVVATKTGHEITDFRIPTDLYPYQYRVELFPNLTGPNPANFTFKGNVKIWMKCKKVTDTLTLHLKGLKVDLKSVIFNRGPRVKFIKEDTDREFLILKLDNTTRKCRKYSVEMNFTSSLKKDLRGLYYSQYIKNGEVIYLATSHFEPTFARMAFPCFDEPALKANFEITLVRPSNYISLSNMPIKRSKKIKIDGVNYVKDTFVRTPNMSTYLLAFVICDFVKIEKTTENGVLFRVWSRPDVIKQTQYAFDIGFKVLSFFEEYFNIRFPLPKLDMVAVPDLEAVGIENWGLIIIREKNILITSRSHAYVAKLVIHELAHQWFGDLVSPDWWDVIWLNEGFCTFMEYIAVDFLNPEREAFEDFIYDFYIKAFDADSSVYSHPIYRSNVHQSELRSIFDAITYKKGAAVIRMMRQFLGYETFRNGLRLYLTKHQYSTATQDDLWSALTEQARLDNKNIDVKEVMDTWTLQMNYPLVTVTRDNSDNGALRVQQERFLEVPNAPDLGRYISPFNYTWNIPLTFASNLTRNFDETDQPIYWLWRNETSKLINASELLPSKNTWFIGNINMNGYYRVNYDRSNWLALAKQLKEDHKGIPVIQRMQIVVDALTFARHDILPYDIVLTIMDYLENERNYLLIFEVVESLSSFIPQLSLSPVYGEFQRFMIKLFNHAFKEVKEKNAALLRLDSFKMYYLSLEFRGCELDIPECVDDYVSKYKRWMNNPNNYSLNVWFRSEISCKAISKGGFNEWNFLLKMYKEGLVHVMDVLQPLACTNIPWLLNSYLLMAIDNDSPVFKPAAGKIIQYISGTPVGRRLAWSFFRTHYNKLKELYEQTKWWVTMVESVTESLNTEVELSELKSFHRDHEGNFGSGEAAMLEAIQKVESNVQWMNKHYNTIADWLKANVN